MFCKWRKENEFILQSNKESTFCNCIIPLPTNLYFSTKLIVHTKVEKKIAHTRTLLYIFSFSLYMRHGTARFFFIFFSTTNLIFGVGFLILVYFSSFNLIYSMTHNLGWKLHRKIH